MVLARSIVVALGWLQSNEVMGQVLLGMNPGEGPAEGEKKAGGERKC